jgi:hypothetical protein
MNNAAMQASDNQVAMDLVKLREELEILKREVQTIKRALKYDIARYEISQVKKGMDTKSILTMQDMEN